MIEIFTLNELLDCIDNSGCINHSITIRGAHIRELKGINRIKGDLFLFDTEIQDLGDIEIIEGNLSFWNKSNEVRLETLGKIKKVTGDVYLRFCTLKSLGKLESVGRTLNLRDTDIFDLSNITTIGKDLFLPMSLKASIDISHISVKGNVKYWNNSKNISPRPLVFEKLVDSDIEIPHWKFKYIISHDEIQFAEDSIQSFFNYFRKSFLHGIYIDVKGETNYLFSLLLEFRDTLNPIKDLNLIKSYFKKLSDCYPVLRHYTTRWIIPILEKNKDYDYLISLLLDDRNDYPLSLLEYFFILNYQSDIIIDSSLIWKLVPNSSLTSFGLQNTEDVKKSFDLRIRNGDSQIIQNFKIYTKRWKKFHDIKYDKKTVKELSIITSFFEREIRESENDLRSNRGLPKIGEGWISETELYYHIKNEFPGLIILHHGKPSWLGRQHLDIYIQDHNIGIEYMGSQHYQSIDFFGGEESLYKTIERDKLKREKCVNNSCTLLIVKENYALNEVISCIHRLVSMPSHFAECIEFPS